MNILENMLTNLWYAVEFSAVLAQQPRQITLMGKEFVLYRDSQGKAIALDNRCAHRSAALALGRVEGDCLHCPYHGWQYQADGVCVNIPANQLGMEIPKRARVEPYPVQEQNGFIWLFVGDLPESQRPSLPELPQFAPNFTEWHQSIDEFCWNANYSRVIENNVDVSHPPFIHRKLGQRVNQDATIQLLQVEPVQGGASVTLTAKLAKLKGFWQMLVAQQEEFGSTRRHSFYLPNFTTLELNFGKFKLAFLMAHVPVSETVTVTKSIILRNFFKCRLFDRSTNQFGRKLLREDEAIVKTQVLQAIGTNRELLVASDAMILAYRKLHKEHADKYPTLHP
ncbi:MAG: aromatic ring-hydroxylating dioxygenase subunit alpha [Drouetiella hepatica Uher 2000/2452]|uniref:Aromatic ring-hydroxylating dioxygenase subunit alpha n=1 Tax=Drouetiella hepatica Uher 2000/2452 TaxID=904376 RepID=A0A951Q7G7_9CYAN|nr:aromatic ring-hydroxylating dioxygenase subunit alpha [Drouetiella hepatica Uher 2000/2452]